MNCDFTSYVTHPTGGNFLILAVFGELAEAINSPTMAGNKYMDSKIYQNLFPTVFDIINQFVSLLLGLTFLIH